MLRAPLLLRRFSSAAAQPLVTFEKKGKVGLLTLNNPAALNAMTESMGVAFSQAIDALPADEVNALVITGAGRAFSAGGDMKFLNDRTNDTGSRNTHIMRAFYQRFIGKLRECPVPTVAAINGPAIGAGLCFALGADVRLAAKSAKLGITFVSLGLSPGMGATHYLPRLIGPQMAARMALTGEVIDGVEAARIGLVASAEEDAELLPKAMELAGRIADQAPVAVRACMRSLRLQTDEGMDRSLWREADAQSYAYSTKDMKEGLAAIAEKRKPVFSQAEHYRSKA